jgi:IclR family transcriptional regulator, acetate operon repressor
MARTVKSAIRVLEVLELFDRLQREASVGEIARELSYPVSSTSLLLANLQDLGYLQRGRDPRCYVPTQRVTGLGGWIEPLLTPSGEVLRIMAELSEHTGETIILATPLGEHAHYLHVLPATRTMRMHVGSGTRRPLVTSGLGQLLLASMDEEDLQQAVLRHNDGPAQGSRPVDLPTLRRKLAALRARRYSVVFHGVTPGAGLIAMLLPLRVHGRPLAVGIGGWAGEMRPRQEHYLELLRASIERHLRDPMAAVGAA